jgi:hypothetical protein
MFGQLDHLQVNHTSALELIQTLQVTALFTNSREGNSLSSMAQVLFCACRLRCATRRLLSA